MSLFITLGLPAAETKGSQKARRRYGTGNEGKNGRNVKKEGRGNQGE